MSSPQGLIHRVPWNERPGLVDRTYYGFHGDGLTVMAPSGCEFTRHRWDFRRQRHDHDNEVYTRPKIFGLFYWINFSG